MDYELNDDQRAILDSVAQLTARHAGPARAISLARSGAYDEELDRELAAAGYLDMLAAGAEVDGSPGPSPGPGPGPGPGPLEAALVVEAVARNAGTVAVGAQVLAVPAVFGSRELPRPIAVMASPAEDVVRFAAQARSLLVLDGEDLRLVALRGVASVNSIFGYPFGRIASELAQTGESLGVGKAAVFRSWWRVALSLECIGSMQAALDVTVEYLRNRRQFGRPIGSFQAVQHRLAECAVLIEGARWLALEAAWAGAPAEAAAVACAHAVHAAGSVFTETHQLTGAIGFTREHDLHVWTMRLQALRREMGGEEGHQDAVSSTRWNAAIS